MKKYLQKQSQYRQLLISLNEIKREKPYYTRMFESVPGGFNQILGSFLCLCQNTGFEEQTFITPLESVFQDLMDEMSVLESHNALPLYSESYLDSIHLALIDIEHCVNEYMKSYLNNMKYKVIDAIQFNPRYPDFLITVEQL